LKEVENWRGINLLNVEWKIFTKLADEWIRAECRAKGILGRNKLSLSVEDGFIGTFCDTGSAARRRRRMWMSLLGP